MVVYAIKINNKFFESFVYYEFKNTRFTGHSTQGNFRDGDIIDIVLSEEVEETFSRRSLSDKIICIYSIEKFRNSKVEIIPIKE